jgi:hypothetical protein
MMPTDVKPVPEGFHSVTPYLCVTEAAEAIEFYKTAFDAEELLRTPVLMGASVTPRYRSAIPRS